MGKVASCRRHDGGRGRSAQLSAVSGQQDSKKESTRSVASNAAAGSHQSSRPQRTQCALGCGSPVATFAAGKSNDRAGRRDRCQPKGLTEGVDRLGAEGEIDRARAAKLCCAAMKLNGYKSVGLGPTATGAAF